MKYGCLLLAFTVTCQAANPSLSSFDSSQFATNNRVIRIKPGATLTNVVLTGTNTIDGDTIVTISQINTNTDGIIGALTPGYLPYAVTTNMLGDSPVLRVDTNTVYVYEVLANILSATNLATGGLIISTVTDGVLTNLAAGNGLLANNGNNSFSWVSPLWTNVSSTLQPVDLALPVRADLIYAYGLSSGADYSRLMIDHTGTAGAIVFDSQSGGTGGTPRPYYFAFGGTNTYLMEADVSTPRFSVRKGTGEKVTLQMSTGGHGLLLGGTGSDLFFGVNNNGSGDFSITSTAFAPTTNGTKDLGGPSFKFAETHTVKVMWDDVANVFDSYGSGSPEGVVTAGIGSTYRRSNGGAGTTFYVKESGTGSTGWSAK